MLYARAEDQHTFSISRQVDDLGTRSTDQKIIVVECFFQLVELVLAAANMHRRQVRLFGAGFRSEFTQEAAIDQLVDADFETNLIEEMLRLADQSVLQPVRRSSQPDHSDQRVDD